MTRTDRSRPLEGLALGVSISESEDAAGLGFSTREVNRTVRRVATSILAQGGRLVFGHDWRPDGVMGEVLRLAIGYHAGVGGDTAPPMVNIVPWPRTSTVAREDRQRYRGVLEIVETGRPDAPAALADDDPALQVLSLTAARRMMNRGCDARLCIGGRTAGAAGLGSGVFEETALTVEAGRPLYVTGLFGGASQQAVLALLDRKLTSPEVVRPGPEIARALAAHDLPSDARDYDRLLRQAGIETIARQNRLSVDDNRRLFAARSLSEVIGLVLKGMARLHG